MKSHWFRQSTESGNRFGAFFLLHDFLSFDFKVPQADVLRLIVSLYIWHTKLFNKTIKTLAWFCWETRNELRIKPQN